jgi:VWFA-related protein
VFRRASLAAAVLIACGVIAIGRAQPNPGLQPGTYERTVAATHSLQPSRRDGQNPKNPPPASQQPTFRTGVNAVRVDVIVTTRNGEPVEDLTRDEFEVSEDGKPQTVESLKLIRVQTRQEPGGEAPRAIRSFDDEATELARDDVRIIVIFLDDYHVSRASAFRLRDWLRHFIDDQIQPYDLVALMYPLTPSSGLTFTRDKYALSSVVGKFEGRRGEYMPRNDLEANYGGADPYTIERIRSEVVMTALRGLCVYLGGLNEGRKSVILVSEGVGADMTRLREVIEAASRGNVAFYPVDPQGLSGPFGAADMLRTLADNTSGRAIVTRNDFEGALNTVLRDSSAYYLLGYNSDKGPDGKFHDIKVRVKRPGVEVRARKGYLAPTREEAAAALAPPKPPPPAPVTNALGSIAAPRGQLIRTWFGMSRGEKDRTRVTFVWEPVPGGPGSASGDARAARVLLTAAAGGQAFFDGAVTDVGPGQATTTPRPARAVFEAPPGRLQVKITIEGQAPAPGQAAEVLESATREIVVPDLASASLRMSTPAVLCARTARDFRALWSDPDAVPTASRLFTRNDRLVIRFGAYTPGPPPTIAVRLLNSAGNEMAQLAAQASTARAGEQSIDLPLANMARGDYVIEITAKGEAGRAVQMVGFRVTG